MSDKKVANLRASRAPGSLPSNLDAQRHESARLVGSLSSAEANEGNLIDLLVYKEFESWDGAKADHIKALYKEEVRYVMLAAKLLTLSKATLEKAPFHISNFEAFILPLRRQYIGMAGAKALGAVLKEQAGEFEKETIFRNLTRELVDTDFQRAGFGAVGINHMLGYQTRDFPAEEKKDPLQGDDN